MVEIAADHMGVAHDDVRRLTITGGLSFAGYMASMQCIPATVTQVILIVDEWNDAIIQ